MPKQCILWPQSIYQGTTLRPLYILYEYMDPLGLDDLGGCFHEFSALDFEEVARDSIAEGGVGSPFDLNPALMSKGYWARE